MNWRSVNVDVSLWSIGVNYRTFYEISWERPGKARKWLRINWLSTLILWYMVMVSIWVIYTNRFFSFKYLILTKTESCSYPRWPSIFTKFYSHQHNNNNYKLHRATHFSFRLLPVKENFLTRQIFKNSNVLTKDDIERVFCLYDRVRVLVSVGPPDTVCLG